MMSSQTVIKNIETGEIYTFLAVCARRDHTFWWTFRSGSHEVNFSIPALGHNEYRERLSQKGFEIIS